MTWVAAAGDIARYAVTAMGNGTSAGGLSTERRRRLLQIVFVFVNLALVETHVPGYLWLIVGGIFWIALVFIAASGSPLVCGTMCWVGAIQDFAEPLARARVRIDPRWGRGLTLTLLLLWMPIAWVVSPYAAAHDHTPLDLDPSTWQRHLFGLGLALAIPVGVAFLGKRGICRFLCPFNSVVGVVRRAFMRTKLPNATLKPGCASAAPKCAGCANASASRTSTLQPKGLRE